LGRGGRQSVGWPWAIVRQFGASKGAMLAADMSYLLFKAFEKRKTCKVRAGCRETGE
jgi:hypothetical protein